MNLLMSRDFIKNHWEGFKKDPYNPRPDIETAEEFIAEIEKGNFKFGGVTVVLQDEILTRENVMRGSSSLSKLAVLAGLMAFAGGAHEVLPTQEPRVQSNRKKFTFSGMPIPAGPSIGSKSARITVAQQKRNSKKAKNRSRHKAACRR